MAYYNICTLLGYKAVVNHGLLCRKGLVPYAHHSLEYYTGTYDTCLAHVLYPAINHVL